MSLTGGMADFHEVSRRRLLTADVDSPSAFVEKSSFREPKAKCVSQIPLNDFSDCST